MLGKIVNFILWFIAYGLSFFISNIFGAEQEKAFFIIYNIPTIILFVLLVVVFSLIIIQNKGDAKVARNF